jgi:hypothetical protein
MGYIQLVFRRRYDLNRELRPGIRLCQEFEVLETRPDLAAQCSLQDDGTDPRGACSQILIPIWLITETAGEKLDKPLHTLR